MDVLTLSRLQFALTAGFHFLFVPLTLGLSVLVAWMETCYVRTGNETYLRMTRFWGKLFLINFALGVVTGITLEFQFGMNWAEYSRYVGDIFGVPLAIEALIAFFLESTFIGVWIFGWKHVSKRVHALSIWIVAVATNFSALWILLANGWMQHPVGYVLRNNRAELVDIWAMVTSPYGWLKFTHTLFSGYVVAAFFVMGVAAYHLLKKTDPDLFKRSFRAAAVFGFVGSLLVFGIGDFHAAEVARTQPTKLAAMESIWETGRAVPLYVLAFPDPRNERNAVEAIGIPKLASFLAFRDFNAEIRGLKSFPPQDRPPVLAVFLSFRTMVALGTLFLLLSLAALYLAFRDRIEAFPLFLKLLVWTIPLPYLATQLGWIVAEMGRQPWIVYGLLRTSDAVSRQITVSQVWLSLVLLTLFYSALGILDVYLLMKYARKGPEPRGSFAVKEV